MIKYILVIFGVTLSFATAVLYLTSFSIEKYKKDSFEICESIASMKNSSEIKVTGHFMDRCFAKIDGEWIEL